MPARIVLAHFEHLRDKTAAELHRGFRVVYDHHAAVSGEPPFADRLPPNANLVAWRFVAQNSRELARGCYFFPDEIRARRHAEAVRSRSAELVLETIPRMGQRGFGWYATLDGRPAAMCARPFQSRSVARSAAERALALLAHNDKGEPPVVIVSESTAGTVVEASDVAGDEEPSALSEPSAVS